MKLLGLSVIGILSGMNRQTYVHLPGKSHTTDDNGQRSRITGGRTSSVDGGRARSAALAEQRSCGGRMEIGKGGVG